MIYTYKCENPNCKANLEQVEKSMAFSSEAEYCKKCHIKMKRIFDAPSIKNGDGFKK